MASFENGYAFVVGIANYAHVRKLPPSVLEDARNISDLLQDAQYCGYPVDQVRLLTDEQATAAHIRDGLGWLAAETGGGDTAVIYFSGHGHRVEMQAHTRNYLMPFDTRLSALADTAIPGRELVDWLQKIRAGRVLVLFDCCYAGGIGELKSGSLTQEFVVKTGLDEHLYDRLGTGKGRAVIASSRSDEVSYVYEGMKNSLFTHYLLQALQGKAPMQGDGLIRLFDLFHYVSQQVAERHSEQHPLLKAEIENNFAIALHLGGKKAAEGQTATRIQNYQNIQLGQAEQDVLLQMFTGYERVVIKGEFGGGFGGGRVLWIRPIQQGEDAQLPIVVKTGPAAIIQQETAAFDRYVSKKVPNVANIDGTPIYSPDKSWAGIRYPLAGHGRFYTESLKSFCRHASTEDVRYVLQSKLFPSIDKMWQDNQVAREAFVTGSFDPILPPNLFTQYSYDTYYDPINLTPDNIYTHSCMRGDSIELTDFIVVEIDVRKSELTLNVPPTGERLPASYRIRVTGNPNLDIYREGEPLPAPINGRVLDTRETYLQQLITRIFAGQVHAHTESITLPGIGSLPNPLPFLAGMKTQSYDVNIGPIHGDLNLENILVEYDQHSHDVILIDFANARRDIVLHDLLRLETGIWLYLVPQLFEDNGRSLTNLPDFLTALHNAVAHQAQPGFLPELEKPFRILTTIRQQAAHYLVETNAWDEYYKGLIVHLLGALKFKNLDAPPLAPLPKQIAFITAAVVLKILQERPFPTQSQQAPTPITDAGLSTTVQPTSQQSAPDPSEPPPLTVKLPADPYEIPSIVAKHFSMVELDDLCYKLKLELDELPGTTKSAKIRELVMHFNRRGLLHKLIATIKAQRPDINWVS